MQKIVCCMLWFVQEYFGVQATAARCVVKEGKIGCAKSSLTHPRDGDLHVTIKAEPPGHRIAPYRIFKFARSKSTRSEHFQIASISGLLISDVIDTSMTDGDCTIADHRLRRLPKNLIATKHQVEWKRGRAQYCSQQCSV